MSFSYPSLPDFKAGDTLSYGGATNLPDGTWTATCQLRQRDNRALVGTIGVTLGTYVDGQTPIVLRAEAADTSAWLTGGTPIPIPCVLDVRFADTTGEVMHTLTIGMRVVPPITGASA